MSDILSKIQKLLALATSSNEHEAMNAARIAERLMAEHAVSVADLEARAQDAEDPMEARAVEINSAGWQASVGWATAKHCNVSALRYSGGLGTYMRGYGRRADLDVWEYLVGLCLRHVEDEARAYRATAEDTSRAAMSTFRVFAAQGVDDKLTAIRSEAELARKLETPARAETTALALRSRAADARQEMIRRNPQRGTFTSSAGRQGSRAAANEGLAAGRRVNPSKALSATRTTQTTKALRG